MLLPLAFALSTLAGQVAAEGPALDSRPGDMYSKKSVRAFIERLEREYEAKKPVLSTTSDKDYREKLEFYRMREHLLMVRTGKSDRLDITRYQKAFEHRRRMPSPPNAQYVGTGWTFFGPRGLPGGGNMGDGPNTGRVNGVCYDPQNPTTFYVAGATGGICKTTNFGGGFSILSDTWDYLYTSDVCVDPTNSNRVYAATGDFPGWWGYGMGIMRSTNGGSSWTQELVNELDGCEVSDIMVDPDNPATVLATAGRGTLDIDGLGVWRSTDYGNTWTRVLGASGDGYSKLAYSRLSGGIRNIYAAHASLGIIKRSRDGGATWVDASPPGSGLVTVATSTVARDTVYCYVSNGNIYKSTNAGDTWTSIEGNFDPANYRQPTFNYAFGCINTQANGSGSDVLVLGLVDFFFDVGADGTWQMIFRSGNDRSVHPDHHGFDPHPTDKRKALISNDGGVFEIQHAQLFGVDLLTSTNLNQSLRLTEHVFASPHPDASTYPDYCLTGMWHNGVGFCTTDPWTWYTIHGADGMYTAIDDANPLIQFSSAQGLGTGDGVIDIYSTTNAWGSTSLFSTATTISNEAFAFITPWDEMPGVTGAITFAGQSLYRLQNVANLPVWTKNIGGVRFNGVSGEVALSVEAIPSNGVFVGTTEGRLFGAFNPSTGMTLIRIFTDPITCISASPSDSDDLLVCTGNAGSPYGDGGIWEVTDALGGSPVVTNRSGSGNTALPALGVNWVVRDPYSPTLVWYAATDLGVYYTDDRGANWYSITEYLGLPNAMVLHLSISDNILYAATFGRGMWRMALYSGKPRVTAFNVSELEETGGNTISVTVNLDRIADPGGQVVSITSNNTTAIPNASVTVPQGSTSGTFTLPTNQVTADTTVTLTATANGGSDSDTVIIRECPVTAVTVANFTGGDDFDITVTLGRAAPIGGADVNLVSNNSQIVQVPPTVTVPQGFTSVRARGTSTLIPTNTQVGIQASRPGSGVQSFFTVYGVNATSVFVVPRSVYNGAGFAVRINLNRNAPKGGFPVALLSGNTNAARLPSQVTIPEGRNTWDVSGTTLYVATDTNVGIRATIWGVPWEDVLLVRHLAISSIAFNPNPLVGGLNTQFTIILDRTVDTDVNVTVTQSPRGWTNLPVIITIPATRNNRTTLVTTQRTPTGKKILVEAWLTGQNIDGPYKALTLHLTPPIAPADGPSGSGGR